MAARMSSELYQLHGYHVNVFYNTYYLSQLFSIHSEKGCRVKEVKPFGCFALTTLHKPLAISGTSPKSLYNIICTISP